jgi:hypothetical protein
MLANFNRFQGKKMFVLLFFLPVFYTSGLFAQSATDTAIEHFVVYNQTAAYKPFSIKGRVIGARLESIKGAEVINLCTGDTAKADDEGIYHINAGKGDTLAFVYGRYSTAILGVRSAKEKFNIILIKRKTESLLPGYSRSDFEKARKDDDELYRILGKDAKEEGKWNY